jgi:transcriptional regulator with XRE-family HTH domain
MDKPEKMALAQKLRSLRESRRFSQEYMASKIGVSQPDYSKIESGKVSIGDKFSSIVQALEMTEETFNNANPYSVNIFNNQFHDSTANIITQINESSKADLLIDKIDKLIDVIKVKI